MNTYEIINTTTYDIENINDINNVINYALKYLKIENSVFNIIIVDNTYIRELNKNYRNKDSETDVISFALNDYSDITTNINMLGDIYISYDKAVEQANTYIHSIKREITFLSVHGLLHLLGYDHMIKEEENIMFKLQEEILDNYEKEAE